MEQGRSILGSVRLPADVPIGAATVVVQVEDVSRADAPSRVVGETRIPLSGLESGAILPFEVRLRDPIQERNSYSVRVHVRFKESERIEEGDLISTRSYPVLTRGASNRVFVEVQRV